jgi:hypothetical protein
VERGWDIGLAVKVREFAVRSFTVDRLNFT